MAITVGARLLGALLSEDKGTQQFLEMELFEELFTGMEERDAFVFCRDFVEVHGVLPATETLKTETAFTVSSPPEPATYYRDKCETRWLHVTLKKKLEAASNVIKNDPVKALEIVEAAALDLRLLKARRDIVNVTEKLPSVIEQDYLQKQLLGDEFGVQVGWPFLDKMTGGLIGGDTLFIVGRPASGKTFLMVRAAMHAWQFHKDTPLVISMEMKPILLMHRIAAILAKKGITKLKTATMSTKAYGEMMTVLKAVPDFGVPFYIVDGKQATTVEDVRVLVRQLKPRCVYIDGAYMLKMRGQRWSSRWERIGGCAEELKGQVATDLNIPVVASYQLNRDIEKTKITFDGAGKKAGVQFIAGADIIGQIGSIVLGLFEPENVENIKKKHVELMKGRGGEVGGWDINWIFDDYPFMDFSEISFTKPKDLQFV